MVSEHHSLLLWGQLEPSNYLLAQHIFGFFSRLQALFIANSWQGLAQTSRAWGSWTGNTSFSTSHIFTMTIWKTPSNYNDDIFISQLELHTDLQNQMGIKTERSSGCRQTQQTIWGVYLWTVNFPTLTLLWKPYSRQVFLLLRSSDNSCLLIHCLDRTVNRLLAL